MRHPVLSSAQDFMDVLVWKLNVLSQKENIALVSRKRAAGSTPQGHQLAPSDGQFSWGRLTSLSSASIYVDTDDRAMNTRD